MDFDNNAFRIVGWIGIGLIAIAVAVVLFRGDWSGVLVLGVFLALSIVFVAFEDKLPALFDLLFVSAAIVNAAGWVWGLFNEVWGYDEFAHFYTTFAAALSLGYLTFYAMREHFRERPLHFVIAVTCFGVTIGAWWEIFELLFLHALQDPVSDLIADSLGALLAGALGLWALRKGFDKEQSEAN